jgi:hypothetical protein
MPEKCFVVGAGPSGLLAAISVALAHPDRSVQVPVCHLGRPAGDVAGAPIGSQPRMPWTSAGLRNARASTGKFCDMICVPESRFDLYAVTCCAGV